MSEESTQHRQYPVSSQRQASHPSSGYPHHSKGQSTSHPIQFNPQVSGHSHQSMVHPHQSAGHPHQPAAQAHQSAGHPHQATRHPHQSAGHPHQATTGHSHQSAGHPHQATTGHSHHPAGPTAGLPSQPISRSNFYAAQSGPKTCTLTTVCDNSVLDNTQVSLLKPINNSVLLTKRILEWLR